MSKYTTVTTVNGREYRKENQPWFNAFMDATDTINILRTQPSFAKPETKIDVTITYTGTNSIAATYSKDGGWDFR